MKTLKIEDKLHLKLKILAAQMEVSLQDLIMELLKKGLRETVNKGE